MPLNAPFELAHVLGPIRLPFNGYSEGVWGEIVLSTKPLTTGIGVGIFAAVP
jgi:hypothetical protein